VNEVACKVLDVFFRRLAREKRPPSLLAEGTGYPLWHLRNKNARMDWAGFVRAMSNAGRLWTDEELIEIGASVFTSPYLRPLALVARLLFDARGFYAWVFEKQRGGGDQAFSCIDHSYREVAPNRLELELNVREGFEPVREFLLVCLGNFQGMPRVLGLPAAWVEMELRGRGALYRVQVPEGGALLARLKRAITYPFTMRALAEDLKETNETLQARYEELEQARASLWRHADQLSTVVKLGQELSAHTDLRGLGDAVAALLQERFGCTALRFWQARHPGEALSVVREVGAFTAPPDKSSDLQTGGELLGRIEMWGFRAEQAGLFEALVPWISIALNNARSFALLLEAQDLLEHRVQERTRELSATTLKLQESVHQLTEMDRQKTQFFANASHELRTPLTLMLLPIESVLSRTDLAPAIRDQLDGVMRGGYRLLKLINDLLDLSKIEVGRMQLRMGPVDLARLLEEVVRPWRAVLGRRGVRLDLQLQPSLSLVADQERLEQVALNLVANAVKHVHDGGRLTVGAAGDQGEVWFWVENTGDGIDPAELDQIFERFGQSSKAKARRFGSTGLGLPLVKDLVELHGGRISVQSEPGASARFEVRLPVGRAAVEDRAVGPVPGPASAELRQYLAEAAGPVPVPGPSPAPAPALAGPEAGARPLLLLAEDNPDLRAFLATSLSPEYEVMEAADGAAALQMARQRTPDIVLSDLMMPTLDGLELCAQLKADPVTSGVPFVLLTARGDVGTKVAGLAGGADDFLVKPFHMVEVQTRLRVQLRMRRLAAQLAHAEKLAALGTVVAGVAHEVRNPLNGIINALIPVKEMTAGQSEEASELLELALVAAQRVEQLTARLLQQVRVGEGEQGEVDVVRNVELALQLLRHKTSRGPKLLPDLPESDRIAVMGEASALSQVWINLIDNAIGAAGPSGVVKVSVKAHDGTVAVEVEDDGPGIPPATLKRIFDPFFTTKEVGQGTGLGLSVARQIVQQHRGKISVQTAPGAGTRFTVTLPELGAQRGESHAHG
jgi:signal transduction histidine kinase